MVGLPLSAMKSIEWHLMGGPMFDLIILTNVSQQRSMPVDSDQPDCFWCFIKNQRIHLWEKMIAKPLGLWLLIIGE